MFFSELKEYSLSDLQDIDSLIRQLSPNSSCDSERLKNVLNDPNSHLYVCRYNENLIHNSETLCQDVECKNKIIACATLCIMHTPEFRTASVEAVVVDKEHRGLGIGRKIMEHLLKEAKNLGVQQLHLTSNPKRVTANALYQSLGFSLYETNCYKMNLVDAKLE